jgi:hypothetical protein
MRKRSLAAMAQVALAILLVAGAAAYAAEVKVWSGGAFRPGLHELGPRFEHTTGHKLVIEFAASPEFLKRIDTGQGFGVAILLPETIDGWIKQGKINGCRPLSAGFVGAVADVVHVWQTAQPGRLGLKAISSRAAVRKYVELLIKLPSKLGGLDEFSKVR